MSHSEEPTASEAGDLSRSEEPASNDIHMQNSEEPESPQPHASILGVTPSVQPSVPWPDIPSEVPIPPRTPAMPNHHKRSSSAITFATNDEVIKHLKHLQTVDL